MAATASKKKTRLDFAAAVEEAVAPITPTQEEVDTVKQEKQVEIIKETIDTAVQTAKVKNEAVIVEETERIENSVMKKEPTRKKKEKIITQDQEEEDEDDPLDALLTSMQAGRGVQKSVYLEEDVYQYIQSKCKKTNAKFSNVLNLLVRSAIKQTKK